MTSGWPIRTMRMPWLRLLKHKGYTASMPLTQQSLGWIWQTPPSVLNTAWRPVMWVIWTFRGWNMSCPGLRRSWQNTIRNSSGKTVWEPAPRFYRPSGTWAMSVPIPIPIMPTASIPMGVITPLRISLQFPKRVQPSFFRMTPQTMRQNPPM